MLEPWEKILLRTRSLPFEVTLSSSFMQNISSDNILAVIRASLYRIVQIPTPAYPHHATKSYVLFMGTRGRRTPLVAVVGRPA
jgi:hypothetical protein